MSHPPLSQQDSALRDLKGKVRRESGVNIQHSGHFSALPEGRLLSHCAQRSERTIVVWMPGAAGRRASSCSQICSASIKEDSELSLLLWVGEGGGRSGVYIVPVLPDFQCAA